MPSTLFSIRVGICYDEHSLSVSCFANLNQDFAEVLLSLILSIKLFLYSDLHLRNNVVTLFRIDLNVAHASSVFVVLAFLCTLFRFLTKRRRVLVNHGISLGLMVTNLLGIDFEAASTIKFDNIFAVFSGVFD